MGGHFVAFASVTRVPLSQAVYTKRCRQTSRISDRRLMETMRPLFKTPGAGAPTCSSILHIDAWRVEKNSSVHFCQAISKQDRQALAESVFVFSIWFSVPHTGVHSTTEQAALANDLPAALSFLLI